MKCPHCSTLLNRCRYEGLPVFNCGSCNGFLVGKSRAKLIESRQQKKTLELVAEAASFAAEKDTEGLSTSKQPASGKLGCPRCHLPMKQQQLKPAHEFYVDDCINCELYWFDAGELAVLQLEHDATEGAQDNLERKERLRNLTDEEKAEFAEDLSKLPEGETMLSAIGSGFLQSFFRRRGLFR